MPFTIFSIFKKSLPAYAFLAPVLTWFAELANFRQSFIQGQILWKKLFSMTDSSQLIFRDQFQPRSYFNGQLAENFWKKGGTEDISQLP